MDRSFALASLFCTSLVAAGCSADPKSSPVGSLAGGSGTPMLPNGGGSGGLAPGGGVGGMAGSLSIIVPPSAGSDAGPGRTPITLDNLTETEVGGYQRGDAIDQGKELPTLADNDGCDVLVGIVRDFNTKDPGRHPDFQDYEGWMATKGLVSPELDAERKPVYASRCELMPDPMFCPTGQQTTDKASFDQWYRNTPGVNHAFLLYFKMEAVGNVVSFQSENFVPVDGVGFNDMYLAPHDDRMHNYGFTTELHLQFRYSGGESFTFKGDDDVWAFINGRLAIDLGGLHESLEEIIVLDDRAAELGLVKGNVYPLELFQAERHSTGSHFRIDSTLSLVDCGGIPIVPK